MESTVSVYRPPGGNSETLSSFISNLDQALTNLTSSSSITCLVGDFNAKLNHWWTGQKSNEAGIELSSLTIDHGLSQLVEGPTRILDNSDPSQVDLMFINNFSIVNSCDVLPPIADHCPTILHLQVCSASRQSGCSSKRRANIDFKGLNTYLSGVDWSPVLRSNDVNTALSSLEHMLTARWTNFPDHPVVL